MHPSEYQTNFSEGRVPHQIVCLRIAAMTGGLRLYMMYTFSAERRVVAIASSSGANPSRDACHSLTHQPKVYPRGYIFIVFARE